MSVWGTKNTLTFSMCVNGSCSAVFPAKKNRDKKKMWWTEEENSQWKLQFNKRPLKNFSRWIFVSLFY